MHLPPEHRYVFHLSVYGRDLVDDWILSLADANARVAVQRRIDRIETGNLGDHRPVGGGVWEIRIHLGPGYRLYYGEEGRRVVLLICGGDKSTQRSDIARAQRLWARYRGLK